MTSFLFALSVALFFFVDPTGVPFDPWIHHKSSIPRVWYYDGIVRYTWAMRPGQPGKSAFSRFIKCEVGVPTRSVKQLHTVPVCPSVWALVALRKLFWDFGPCQIFHLQSIAPQNKAHFLTRIICRALGACHHRQGLIFCNTSCCVYFCFNTVGCSFFNISSAGLHA